MCPCVLVSVTNPSKQVNYLFPSEHCTGLTRSPGPMFQIQVEGQWHHRQTKWSLCTPCPSSWPSLAKAMSLSWVSVTNVHWRGLEKAAVPQFQTIYSVNRRRLANSFANPPHCCIPTLTARILSLFLWMYFKAVGKITKECETMDRPMHHFMYSENGATHHHKGKNRLKISNWGLQYLVQ